MNALPHKDLTHHYSDHIILPKSVYDSMDWTTGFLFVEITNKLGQSVIGGLHNTHTEDDKTVYLPFWMLNHLDSWYGITCHQYYVNPCSELKLRVCDRSLITDQEFVDTLNKTLEKYSSVMLNSKIVIPYKGNTCAYVDSFKPLGAAVHLKKETVLSLILAPYEAPTVSSAAAAADDDAYIPFLALNPRKKKKPYAFAFTGASHTSSSPGAFVLTPAELRDRALAAARRRKEAGGYKFIRDKN